MADKNPKLIDDLVDDDDEIEEEDDSSEDVSESRPRPSFQRGGRSGQGRGGDRDRGDRGGDRGGDGGSRGRYKRPMQFRGRRKVCSFCVDKVKVIDWKNPDGLRRFVGEGGSIRARRKTGTCAKHQRRLAVAIKRARHLALLPFTIEHIRLANKN